MRYALAALAAMSLGSFTSAKADLAPPVPPPTDVKIKVELDENAKGSKLIIPLGLTQPRRGPRPFPPGKKELPPTAPPPVGAKPPAAEQPEGEFDIDADQLVVEYADEPTPTNRKHLLIAGLALTLAFSFGGLYLVRRAGRGSFRAMLLFVAAGAALAGSTVAYANAPPPPKPPVVALPTLFDGKINLEITFGAGDTIRFVLDKATYEKLKEKPKGTK